MPAGCKLLVLFFCIVLCFNQVQAKNVVIKNVPQDITDNIFLYLIIGPTIADSIKYKLEDGLDFPSGDFDKENETVFYFPGWGENKKNESVQTIIDALLHIHSINIILLDYSVLVKANNNMEYAASVINASYIGYAIGQYFQQYTPTVQLSDLLHMVSHSLGSQIMSKAARTYGAGELPWLTAMDPAGPLFNMPGVEHLTKSDGIFVDVIHTDGGYYGDYRSVGTVDFFPNRGIRVQPYCQGNNNSFCSHQMSWRYYAESITSPDNFPARKCIRSRVCDDSLQLCTCTPYGEDYIYMGYGVNKSSTGNFYLKTNAKSPFGQGMAGMIF